MAKKRGSSTDDLELDGVTLWTTPANPNHPGLKPAEGATSVDFAKALASTILEETAELRRPFQTKLNPETLKIPMG